MYSPLAQNREGVKGLVNKNWNLPILSLKFTFGICGG